MNGESGSSSDGDTILRTLLRRNPARTLKPIWREHTIYTVIFRRTQDVIIWKRTKVTRDPCRRNLESREDWIAQTTTFGDTVTSDHTVLDGENESQLRHQHSVVVQDLATRWIQSCPCSNKNAQDTMRRLRVIYTDNSLEFIKASEDLPWKCDTSTSRRSETSGMAERAVRKVKEGTSIVFVRSGLDERWCGEVMECYSCSRHIQDFSAGKAPYARRYDTPFRWSMSTFWSRILSSNFHQKRTGLSNSGQKSSNVSFIGYALNAERLDGGPTRDRCGRVERQHCIESPRRKVQ